jgi:hypothetical protein
MTKAATNKPIPVSALAYRPRDYFGRYDRQVLSRLHPMFMGGEHLPNRSPWAR